MALPGKIMEIVSSIAPQSDLEHRLLKALIRRLENSLAILEKALGRECAQECFRYLVHELAEQRSTEVFDKYEGWVERCARKQTGRPLSEPEEEMLSEIVGHVTGIIELLVGLAGIELEDPEDEDEPDEEE